MRYMMIVKGDENFDRSGPPPQALFEAIDKLGQDAAKAGKMVSMGGLRHTADGARIQQVAGRLSRLRLRGDDLLIQRSVADDKVLHELSEGNDDGLEPPR